MASKLKYNTPEYRAAKLAQKRAQARGEWLTCVERTCLMPSRHIAPTQAADVAHDPSGTVIIGDAHARCNRSEGATRGNRMRGARQRRWAL